MQGGGGDGRRRARGPRGGRVDRRDRRAARHRQGDPRDRRRAARARRRRRRPTSARRSAPPTRSPRAPSLEVQLPSGTVRLCAQAKGAGMISPAFATMLCFVQTDAALEPETADLLLGVCVKRSFDRISVDGQLSTNDTAILMASGASGVRVVPESEDELRFGEALDMLLRRLALLMARDGEGARRVGRVVVHGGHEDDRRARGARGRRLAAREGRAARRRPQLGPDRAGGRRRAARHRAAAARHLDRGRPGVPRRGGAAVRRVGARRRGGGRRGRVRRSACPARAPRPRCSSPTSRTST